ncbi:hypothetical protein STCU_10177 [Strigomonas culicis]|uniref:PIK-related kinase FAT domain-containing protein n=1 Tax=Strigomonas culicis TaxID=28005 RepID=S9TJ96_9TRYP|nr:hypothetical protein STCU_10177 [Strigomonas culicis]|eukprot:EPY18117.1 hypothetical protein STCU_10177 [Strigomonas culicis]
MLETREEGKKMPTVEFRVDNLVRVLTMRMEVTEPTLEAREPIMSLHCVLYKTLNLPEKVADAWLQYAQLLKDAGLYEAAWRAARQAVIEGEDAVLSPDYYRLSAQLLYDMGNSRQAIEFAQGRVDDSKVPAEVRSELKVLMTNWSLETGSQSTNDVIASYKAALGLYESDDAYYYLALFYDKVYITCAESLSARVSVEHTSADHEMVQLISTYALHAVQQYGLALTRGSARSRSRSPVC